MVNNSRGNGENIAAIKDDDTKIKKIRKPLLVLLSDNCRKHKISGNTHHECNNILTEEWDDVPGYCQEALTALKRILPRVEHRIPIGNNVKVSSSVSDLGHLCDFYNDVIRGGFCPHALHLFDLGKGAVEGTILKFEIYSMVVQRVLI
jgi:hypothetical protein